MNLRAVIAIACIPVAAQPSHLRAQLPAPPGSQTPYLTAHSTLVLVPALVRTKSGNLVFTLTANDFLLTDDAVPQHLTLEQDTAAQPLALVLAIETGGAGARELDKLTTLGPMLDAVIGNVPHKIAVVSFDSQPTLLQNFTASTEATAATLHDLSPGDNGAAILDGLGFSVDLVPNPPNGCMGRDPNLAPRTTKTSQAYDCLAQLAPPLALARLAIIAATNSLRRNIPETVANLTGGEYFKLTDSKSLERSLLSVSNHIPNRYILSFQPRSPHPGLHVLSLQVRTDTALKVTARSTYWADPAITSLPQP